MSNKCLTNESAKQTLAKRAAQIAKENIEHISFSYSNILVFTLGNHQKYAMDYDAIEKIIFDQKITPIPGINPIFSGLIYHNAESWPVINLSLLLDSQPSDTVRHFILLYEGTHRYALSVGAIIGQMAYDKSIELATLSTQQASKQLHILGIYQSDIAFLDTANILKILASTEVTSIHPMRDNHEQQ